VNDGDLEENNTDGSLGRMAVIDVDLLKEVEDDFARDASVTGVECVIYDEN
jgi:hypothetical protein